VRIVADCLPRDFIPLQVPELLKFIHRSFLHRRNRIEIHADDTPAGDKPPFYWIDGNWRYSDTIYGSEPFGGSITIFWRKSHKAPWLPCWLMCIRGRVEPNIEQLYKDFAHACLDDALKAAPKYFPFRGPSVSVTPVFGHGKFYYSHIGHGNIFDCDGEESIHDPHGNLLYSAKYFGGLINLHD